MSDQDRAAPDMGEPASRPWHLGRYALVVIVCLIAAWAGWEQGQHRTTDQPSGFSSSSTNGTSTPNCPPLAGATVTDQLTFHSNALLGPYEISRTVMVPIDDPNAHAFLTRRDPMVGRAVACLFPASITSAPALKSVKDGMATLTASSQLPLSLPQAPHTRSNAPPALLPLPGSEWRAVIHPHGIGFAFDPRAICSKAARHRTNWAGSVFTVTVVTDVAPRQMSPPPHSFQPHSSQGPSYSWTRPYTLCGTFQGVYVSVPTNLTEHWAVMAYIWYREARLFVQGLLGATVPLIITFVGLCLILFLLRGQKYARRIALVAVLGALLAAVDLSFSYVAATGKSVNFAAVGKSLNFDPAELFGVYGAVLVLLLSLRHSRRSLVLAGIAVVGVTAMALGYHWWLEGDWLNSHGDFIYILFAVLAFVLLASIVIVSCGTARRVMAGESYASEGLGWLDRVLRALYTYERHSAKKRDGVRSRVVFWTGSALVAALAYSMGNVQPVILNSHTTPDKFFALQSEFFALRSALVVFAVPLIAIALVIPLASHDLSKGQDLSKGKADAGRDSKPKSWWRGEPGRFVAAAAFGWAMVARLPYLIFAFFPLPAAQFLLAIIVYATVKRNPPTRMFSRAPREPELLAACQPQRGPKGNAILAAKISGALAIIPIGYFIYIATPLWSAELQQPGLGSVLVAASVLYQLTGWILAGIIFAALSPRLPGKVGPVRAFYLTVVWFAAALPVQIINYWTGHFAGWAWILPGLLLLLFLVTFSVAWDAYILNPSLGWGTWMATLSKVAKAYKMERTGAIIRYAVPVLVALVGVGGILASGKAGLPASGNAGPLASGNVGEFLKRLLELLGAFAGQ